MAQVKAKASSYVKTDVEGRRHREQTGLDTQVVFAVNDECHRSEKNLMINLYINYSLSSLFVYKLHIY